MTERPVIRAGAAEVYGHVPLLAADFTSNQARVLSFFDSSGVLLGQPIVLVNSIFFRARPRVRPACRRTLDQAPARWLECRA